jgi:hypothetical protein
MEQTMELELLIVGIVRRWADAAAPDAPHVADTAAAAALRAFAGGASFSEACREGRRYIGCTRRHPSSYVEQPLPRQAA